MDGERGREANSADLAIALGKVLSIHISAYILSVAKPGGREAALTAMADAVHSDIMSFAESEEIGKKFDAFMRKRMGH